VVTHEFWITYDKHVYLLHFDRDSFVNIRVVWVSSIVSFLSSMLYLMLNNLVDVIVLR